MLRLSSHFAALALIIGTMAAPTLLAQDHNMDGPPPGGIHHAPPSPEQETARLTQKLGLSSDQAAKILAILQNQRQQMKDAHNNAGADAREQMRSIHQQTDAQIMAVLSAAQQQTYQAMRAQMHQHMHGAGDDHGDANDGGQGTQN